MQKKSGFVSLALVLFLGLAPFGFAQLENPLSPSHRTLGYFNSDTGLFEPLRPGLQDPELVTTTPTTGTLVFNFTITLKSTIPAHGIVLCSASGDVIETNFSAAEAGLGIAHLVSGNTYSCSVSMPYSWLLNTPSTDKIILAYTLDRALLQVAGSTSARSFDEGRGLFERHSQFCRVERLIENISIFC